MAAAANKSEPLKIMISGAPASGKGTQCELIKKKVNFFFQLAIEFLCVVKLFGILLGFIVDIIELFLVVDV